MPLKTCALATALVTCLTTQASAQQRIEINNIYPMSGTYYQLADRIFFTQDNKGQFEVVEGPIQDGPARCIGSGFGFQDGTSTIQGICIFGEGEDTFTMDWFAGEQGAANTWNIVQGTGKYEGMTGNGIATTGVEVMYRAMPFRETHIIGTVTLKGE